MSKKQQPVNAVDENELDPYELSRENSLVTQAGLQTAIFSISTSALFSVWRTVIENMKWVPSFWVHFAIGLITFFLLLSLLYAVLALFLLTNTDKQKVTNAYLKMNNNRRVRRLRISIFFFLIAISLVFIIVFTYVPIFYFFR